MAFEDFAEYGSSAVNSEWTTITLSKNYSRNIAIFAEVNSFNDGAPSSDRKKNTLAPVEIRLRNITKGSAGTPASFEIKIQRPYGYNATHPSETVSFLAISEGTWDLVDSSRLEVGIYDRIHTKNNKFQNQIFSNSFSAKPGLISQVQTTDGTDWITLRHRNISSTGFQVAHQEDERQNKHGSKEHVIESLAYLAFDDSFSTTDGDSLIEGRLLDSNSQKIDHTGQSFSFLTNTFSANPVLLTQNVSYNGGNPSKTRLSALTTSGFTAYIQEDQSRDNETWHVLEEISYFAVADGTKFQGEIVDPAAAPSIQGFSGNLGDASSSISINENTTEVGSLSANESVTWSLSGGSDQALFTINNTTGELSFSDAQDFESPGDSDSNNDFVVQTTATDSDNNTATHTVTVNLVDLDETAPVAVDNTEDLQSNTISNNINILANDTDNIDDPSDLKLYSVNGILFDDLDDSEHSTYGVSSNYKQVVGSDGTLYLKSDGTAYYIKNSSSSLSSSSLRSNFISKNSIQRQRQSLMSAFISSRPREYYATAFVSTIDTFNYIAQDTSGNSSNQATIQINNIQSGSSDGCDPMIIFGDDLSNNLGGSCGNDSLFGLGGDDILTGYDGDDLLIGNRGFDLLRGSAGDDTLRAGKGRDILDGGAGSDEMYGGFGLNTFKSSFDGSVDKLFVKSDEWLFNDFYGRSNNNKSGLKSDKIEKIDANDQIFIQGVQTSQISFQQVNHQSQLGEILAGIGIYALSSLEAVYVGGNLSVDQLSSITQGIENV